MVAIQAMAEQWWEHLRLTLLKALANECADGRGHESLLMDLAHAVFIAADRDQVREALLWLHERRLVSADVVSEALVAQITSLGREVVAGRRIVAGVKEPSATTALKSAAELQSLISGLKRG